MCSFMQFLNGWLSSSGHNLQESSPHLIIISEQVGDLINDGLLSGKLT